MLIKGYRITTKAKTLIIKFLLSSIAMWLGFTWQIHNENQRWDNLIYPGIKVVNIDIGGKTKDESRDLIKLEYIDPLIRKKGNVTINNKNYIMEYSKLIENYDIDSIINETFKLGKNLGFYQKYETRKQGITDEFQVPLTFNDKYIKDFIEDIERDNNQEPINASIMTTPDGNINIVNDVRGYKVQAEKLEKYIKDNIINESYKDVTIELPIEETMASITAEKLSSIDTLISSFNTSLASSSTQKTNNIELGLKAINGKVLMPEETFSFNEIVGERTKERGFMSTLVIKNGKLENGIGGGICQLSSTLYNTVLRSGIKPLERKYHTLPVSYVGLGLDATVDWGNIDFKFKNTLEYPIYMEGYIKNKKLFINMYSNSILAKRKYTIGNEVYSVVKSVTETVNDSSLIEGQVIVTQSGRDGYKVRVTRNSYEDETLINSEVISEDFYKPITRIVKVGIINNK